MARERSKPLTLRCAIYTRKSSEEGLEQDFNSLDAQREACAAFIASQRHEGWMALPQFYDDGGYSGGTLERPALQRLLADVQAGRIDVVVVYKVDRLTRSLADFAKIVETFDARGVSFVSVTQAFNTTSSMGRLTLNVLLSFAQFEREVTGERIRDKIAASKKKGLWMGGFVPLGYDAKERTLVVNEAEAETVRTVYRLYLETKNVRLVQAELARLELMTKRIITETGRVMGGRPFSRGHIYKILANAIYVGEIVHKDVRYPGQHPAIIDRETWNSVEATLRGNARGQRSRANAKEPSLLAGLIYDNCGNRFLATHAVKNGKRYRYYAVQPAGPAQRSDAESRSFRIPAFEIEAAVANQLAQFLSDPIHLTEQLALDEPAPAELRAAHTRAKEIAVEILRHQASSQRSILIHLIERIVVGERTMRITLKRRDLAARLLGTAESKSDSGDRASDTITVECPIDLTRRGAETRLILENGNGQGRSAPDAALVKAVARGHDWFEGLVSGRYGSFRDIVAREGVDESTIAKLLRLTFLSPAYVEAIMEGRQQAKLTKFDVIAWNSVSVVWREQNFLLRSD